MTIYDRITADIKTFHKAGKTTECTVLKLLKSDIDSRKASLSPSKPYSLEDKDVELDLFSYVKNIKENIKLYTSRDKEFDTSKLELEIETLSVYLPKSLTSKEIETELKAYIETNGNDVKTLNMFRKYINTKYPKLVDNQLVNILLKNLTKE